MLFILIDLFLNLVHYLNYEAAFKDIMYASLLYIPKSASYAVPISLIFAIAYTLGELYSKNELTSIISSGIPFWRAGASLIIIGMIASVFSFFFEDRVVVPTLKEKTALTRKLRHIQTTEKNSDIVIKANQGRRIYHIDYFDMVNTVLNGVIIIERDDQRRFASQIRAVSAQWEETKWKFNNAVCYIWDGKWLPVDNFIPSEDYTENPEIFRRNAVQPEDLSVRDLGLLVQDLKLAGLPYLKALADYYHRYSFSSVSFILVILSISMGGRFRKNIMLMSLASSLGIGVVYYVMEMISMMLAGSGYIPPAAGAWFPVIFFTIAGAVLVRYSKT
jgi:lipopolysaccharide export system permease protein